MTKEEYQKRFQTLKDLQKSHNSNSQIDPLVDPNLEIIHEVVYEIPYEKATVVCESGIWYIRKNDHNDDDDIFIIEDRERGIYFEATEELLKYNCVRTYEQFEELKRLVEKDQYGTNSNSLH